MAAGRTRLLCSRLDPDRCIVTILSPHVQALQVGTRYNKHMHKHGKMRRRQATGGIAAIERYVHVSKRFDYWTCKRRTLFVSRLQICRQIPYILETNSHPFYSFRGLKNHMWIRIACGLDLRSWTGFWKNDRATAHALRTIQYNNLLFYLLLITLYPIFIIYYSPDSPSSLITESLSFTQSLSSSSSPSSSHRCGLEPLTNFIFI